ncbi:hypothetical protein ACWGMA_36745 [Streptomyces asiaticus]
MFGALHGDQATVDGRTLKAIVLLHSTGVEEDQVGIRIEADAVAGRWYVTDLGLSVGRRHGIDG